MADKILVVDDEKEIADLVALYLENENYQVFKYYNGMDALRCIEQEDLDLAILDIMLPDISGLTLCRKIREKYTQEHAAADRQGKACAAKYSYPIIMLTAKGEETDKVTGLTFGADDYVTKPFLPLELMARVRAQLRRYKQYNTGPAAADEDVIVHSGLVLNARTHECFLNEKPLSLTPTEFSILLILCRSKGEVVSSEELFHQIWKDEYYSKNNNTITVHIRHLRAKMGDSFEHPKYIKTVWGCGYKIENDC